MKTCPVYRSGDVKFPAGHLPIKAEWDNYRAEAQERVWMSPEKFLKLATSPGQFNKASLDYIDAKAMGPKRVGAGSMSSLFFDVDTKTCRVRGHEGRHRSLWAYQMGFPVYQL